MSFGGKNDQLLAQIIKILAKKNILMVAAAGNGGKDALPVFPASYSAVVAVTAIDMSKQIYRYAQPGDYIDVAAPGVDIWVANKEQGGYFVSGTSFATPYVLSVLAINNIYHIDQARLYIKNNHEDLGVKGKDKWFGMGLIKLNCLK